MGIVRPHSQNLKMECDTEKLRSNGFLVTNKPYLLSAQFSYSQLLGDSIQGCSLKFASELGLWLVYDVLIARKKFWRPV